MEIPYGKVIIYVLTFLGYAYSGYGSGLLANLRDAVLAAENVFGDVLNNVINVAKKFKNLHDVFDAAVEEDCIFKCPGEGVMLCRFPQLWSMESTWLVGWNCIIDFGVVPLKAMMPLQPENEEDSTIQIFYVPNVCVSPKPDRNHVPKADGCGSLGLKIDSQYLAVGEMKKCCDTHDICYDTCNNNKEVCDMEFKRCLYKCCDTYKNTVGDSMVKACKGAAKVLFTGTLALGCKSYLDAQAKACYCPSYGWKKGYSKHTKYTRGDGEL